MPKEKNQKFSWKPKKPFSGNKEIFLLIILSMTEC